MLKLLLQQQRHADEQGLIWLPRRDQMGDMLDMTVETAGRVISRLRAEGVLKRVPPQQARVHLARLAAALQAIDA